MSSTTSRPVVNKYTHPSTPSDAYPDYQKWHQSVLLNAPSSTELWAASKFLGRECSEVNTAFLKCKMEKGEHPGLCINQGDLVRLCTTNTIASLKADCPIEYAAYQKCLDQNDYRIEGCLGPESDLVNLWNKKRGK